MNPIINRLFAIGNTMKLGLENSIRLSEVQGHPHQKFRSIHVAGTNGKGSVCTKIAKALECAGYRVGLYTSPHITTFRERICINGEMISEETAVSILKRLFSYNINASCFELLTALAFEYFSQKNVDFAVIETGLGGRLDSTNIITPVLSIITSIALDHTEILGDDIEAIAKEKAGIIKPNVPVIIGPTVPEHIIQAFTSNYKCTIEDDNNAIARDGLEKLGIKKDAIQAGLKEQPPCRYETPIPGVILDVAHNPAALERLFAKVKQDYPGRLLHIVLGLSQNKDISSCLQVIKEHAHKVHLMDANHERTIPVAQLEKECLNIGLSTICTKPLEESISSALKHHHIVIVCGTFFIMDTAKKSLSHLFLPLKGLIEVTSQ